MTPLRAVLAASALLLVGATAWLMSPVTYARSSSPNGLFTARTTHQLYRSLLPMMPGSSGDKPGTVEVFRASDGQSCGAANVPMVSLGVELQWTSSDATLIGVAVWNLNTCSVDTSGW